MSRAIGYPYAEAKALYVRGLLHQRRSARAAAQTDLEAALAICRRLGERLYAAHIERVLS